MKKRLLVLAAAAVLMLLGAPVADAQKNEAPIYPSAENGWKKVKPEKHGFSKEALNEITNYLIDSTRATGVAVIVGGEMIYSFGALDRLSYLASCRKSVLAMLYGKYVENGTIDLSQTIEDLGLDDIGGLLPIEKKATVYDLITARSGCYHPASNPGDSDKKPERGAKKPGEYFVYNNWDFNVAGFVLEMKTGKNIYDILGEDLAIPIGMQDWDRDAQKKGGNLKISIYPAYHFYLSVRDMARLGYLMLREGNWDGEQLISKDWIHKMTTPVSTLKEVSATSKTTRYSYGYMWWLFDKRSKNYLPQYKGAYGARGAMGQFITVIPELDMVVAFKTDAIYKRKTSHGQYHTFLDMLVQAKE